MAAGIAWRVLRQSPGCSSKRTDAAHAAHLAEGRGDPQADAQLFLHAPQQVFQVFQAAQGFERAARRCSSLAGQEEDATVRAGRLQALAFADAGAGRAGLAEGRGSAHGNIIAGDRRPAPLRSVALASALQRFSGTLPCCSRPLRMA